VIQAIDRAAQVLRALQGSRHLGVSELGARLDLPPSTVHGIVKSLQAHGLVAKEPHGQRYMLGPTLLQLSNVYLDTLDVRARAMRWTSDLSERTGLAVRLGVEFFDEVIVIHHEPRPDGSRQMPETGLTIPAHASALGKVLLAHHPAFREQVLAAGPLRSLTGDTIVDPDALRRQLEDVLRTGLGLEQEEAVLGEASVAAAIADRDNEAVAAVAVVFPADQEPVDPKVLTLLRECARNVSRELGATSWPPSVTDVDP
jgi:DNA-binding IclR family transcriptional regulator